jgi:hypothetical protein
MIAFGFLDVKADPLDPLLEVEVEHFARRRHAGRGQHRNHVKRDAVPAQQADAGDCSIKGATARSGQSIAVMKTARAVDADPDIDLRLSEKCTPGIIDQSAVRLKRMNDLQLSRP